TEHERLLRKLVEPSLLGKTGVPQPQRFVAPRGTIDERIDPIALHESTKLLRRCRAFSEIHEMRLDTSLGEETQRLPSFRAFLYSKDLNFHRLACLRIAA